MAWHFTRGKPRAICEASHSLRAVSLPGGPQFAFDRRGVGQVWSFDHGFLFGLPAVVEQGKRLYNAGWTSETLANLPGPGADSVLNNAFRFSVAELRAAARPLRFIRTNQIAEMISNIPREWGIQPHERVALARCIRNRQRLMLELWSENGGA